MQLSTLFNPLKAKLNPIYPLLALYVDHHILHVSRQRVKQPHKFVSGDIWGYSYSVQTLHLF